jgi:hypothetical protein
MTAPKLVKDAKTAAMLVTMIEEACRQMVMFIEKGVSPEMAKNVVVTSYRKALCETIEETP